MSPTDEELQRKFETYCLEHCTSQQAIPRSSDIYAAGYRAAEAAQQVTIERLREALASLLHEDGGSLSYSAGNPVCVAARAALKG